MTSYNWSLPPSAGTVMEVFLLLFVFMHFFLLLFFFFDSFTRYMLQAHMEITLHLPLMSHNLSTPMGSPMLLPIHISTRVGNCISPHMCSSISLFVVTQVESGKSIISSVNCYVCRWICCFWSEPCDYSGAAAWRRRRCGFGHARWSCNWFGTWLSLLRLLMSWLMHICSFPVPLYSQHMTSSLCSHKTSNEACLLGYIYWASLW